MNTKNRKEGAYRKVRKLSKMQKNLILLLFVFFCGNICNVYKQEVRFVTNASTKQNIIEVAESKRTDPQCKNVLARLQNIEDLISEKARYHSACMANFYKESSSKKVGHPASQSTKDFIEYIIQYIQYNKSECQFSINQMKAEFTDDPNFKFPNVTTIKNKLQIFFTNEIILHTFKNDLIILYKTNITKELAENWYENKLKNRGEEALRIVEMAAKICLEEIRSTCYANDQYELPDLKKENLFNSIPKTLSTFLSIIIKTHKDTNESNQRRYDKKIATLSHCIISSARPRSFSRQFYSGYHQ